MRLLLSLLVVAFVFLAGCEYPVVNTRLAPPENESIARNYVELLRQGKYDRIKDDLDPILVDPALAHKLAAMAANFPSETQESSKVVGASTANGHNYSESYVALEYEFPNQWLLMKVFTRQKGTVTTLTGFTVEPLSESVENLNRFTLIGKGSIQYLTLSLATCSLLFSFWALITYLRSEPGPLKWLWVPFILTGVSRFSVNWTTAVWDFTVLSVQFPCGVALHAVYGAWIVSASIPLPAIFLMNRLWTMKITGELLPKQADAQKSENPHSNL
jgi:hypothetical protein